MGFLACAWISRALIDVLERSLRDTMSSTSDDTIEKFTAAFKELMDCFCSKSALTTWRLVDIVHKDVVQLGSALETLNDNGKARPLFAIYNHNF